MKKMPSAHQSGVLANNFNVWEKSRKTGLTLNTKAINIIWGGESSRSRYWKGSSDGSSEVVELLGVYWLEVTGNIPLRLLSPATKYKLYFNIKLNSAASGWDTNPVVLKLNMPGNKTISKEIMISKYSYNEWVDVPQDGLEFFVPEDSSGMLAFAMYDIEREWKKGLVIREVKLVPQPEVMIRTII